MAVAVEEVTHATPLAEALSEEAAAVAARISASVVLVRGSRGGSGSGVVWNGQRLVVTNDHVVARTEGATVVLQDGTQLGARVVRRSPELDLAALQVEDREDLLTPGEVGDSSRLRVGDLILAVGNPMGERNAVTLGIVSAIGTPRPVIAGEPILASITLRPGNSGGALADAHGRIVGVPYMVLGRGLALAVSSRAVNWFLKEGWPFASPLDEWQDRLNTYAA
jgi:serine protease Do